MAGSGEDANLPPHLFSVAAASYSAMLNDARNQSLFWISGWWGGLWKIFKSYLCNRYVINPFPDMQSKFYWHWLGSNICIINQLAKVHHHFWREWGWQDGGYKEDTYARSQEAQDSMTRNISARCLDGFPFFFGRGWSEGTLPISNAFQDRPSANNGIAVGWYGWMPGGHETEKTSIEDQVLKSNPILEAFGNVQGLGLDLFLTPQKRSPTPHTSTLEAFAPFLWTVLRPRPSETIIPLVSGNSLT